MASKQHDLFIIKTNVNDVSFVRDLMSNESKSIALEQSLAPLWKFTFYGGFLFDWCRPIRYGFISMVLRCLFICFCLSSLLYHMVKFVIRVFRVIVDPSMSLQQILIQFMSFCSLPLIMITWLSYLIFRNRLLTFFREWKRLEKQQLFKYADSDRIERICKVIFVSYFSFSLCMLFAFVAFLFTEDTSNLEEDLLIPLFPKLATLSVYTESIRYLPILMVLFMSVFVSLIDIVPVLVYYHGSKILKDMECDLVRLVEEEEDPMFIRTDKSNLFFHRIGSRFENLRVMLDKADSLFGPLVIANHGVTFFVICSSIFSLLNMLKNPKDAQGFVFILASLVVFPFRLLFSIGLMSSVHSAASELLSSMACYWARNWYSLGKAESRSLNSLVDRLQHAKLAASPSGYYKITPSILLTMLSLIVTYTIVLLQSK